MSPHSSYRLITQGGPKPPIFNIHYTDAIL